MVIVPGGRTFVCSGIRIKSNVHLYSEPRSVIRAPTEKSDHAESQFGAEIEAVDADSISLTVFGRIEGKGSLFVTKDLGCIYDVKSWRSGLLFFLDCRQVTLWDLSLAESPWWTIHLVGCNDALA